MDHYQENTDTEPPIKGAEIQLKNPNQDILKDKWKFLIVLILAQLGQQYNFQAVETVQVPLQTELGMDEKGYGYLIMAQSLPGLIIPFFSGYIIDYVGASPGFTGSIVLTLIGHSITTFGAYEKSYLLFVAGKVIFLIAYEATYLARIKLLRIWFSDEELNRANSYIILSQTTAVIICDVAYPNIYEATHSLGLAFLVGSFISIFSVGMCFFTARMHRRLLHNLNFDKIQEDSHQMSFKIIRQFPALMWYMVLTLTTGLVSFILSKIYLSKFLQNDFGFTIGEAGLFLAGSQALSAVAAISSGIFADRFGKLPYLSIVACLSSIIAISLNIVIPKCDKCFLPAIPIIFLSLVTAPLFIGAYGAITRLIPEKNLGMATSTIPVCISIEMAVFSPLAGAIANQTIDSVGYRWVFALALGIAIAGLLLAIKVQLTDLAGNRILQEVTRKPIVAEEVTSPTEVERGEEPDSYIVSPPEVY